MQKKKTLSPNASPNMVAVFTKGHLVVRTPEWTEINRCDEEHTAHVDDTQSRALGGPEVEEKPTRCPIQIQLNLRLKPGGYCKLLRKVLPRSQPMTRW